jgi:glycogen debranching enzyme
MDTGIRIPARRKAQYFYGDNIEGYHEGVTHTTGGGSGYWLEGQPLFRDFTIAADKDAFAKEQAKGAEILPHGIRHHYAGGTSDELSVLHRQRAIAITVTGKAKTKTDINLLFDGGAGEQKIRPAGDGFVITFKHHRFAAGVCATVPLNLAGASTHGDLRGPAFETKKPAREVTLYIAFDHQPARAAKQAATLARNHGRAAHRAAIDDILGRSVIETGDAAYDRAVAWAKLTSYFLVTGEFGKGIWAGLPWFKNNWGRDTFIALPGTLLVTGLFDDAREVILNFLRYQDRNPKSITYGRVPNRVQSATDIIYNTADGTPWLIRELFEYLQYTGDVSLAREAYPQVKLALDGAIKKHVDAEGFLTHDDADTWMDARIEGNLPWSARGNRANDIQALWHNALLTGERLAQLNHDASSARRWRTLADKLRANFIRRFWNTRKKLLADRITEANRRDEKIRPNQLMLLSIPMLEPLLDDAKSEQVVRNAVSELLYPYGIASLSQRDPYFHPYHHNDAWHHFDAAYHNGTVWGWNAGFTITALCRTGQQELAAKLAKNLTNQILNMGCRGSMSELLEAIPRSGNFPQLSGTWAQAWSTSEFARNAFQDFLGFQPRLLDGELHLAPRLPARWKKINAVLAFGRGANLKVSLQRTGLELTLRIEPHYEGETLTLCLDLHHGGWRFALEEPLPSGHTLRLKVNRNTLTMNGRHTFTGEKIPPTAPLEFARPTLPENARCLREKHFLQKLIEKGRFR